MELYDVMITTFATRDFTDEPLPDETLFKILDHTRIAPSGGNRQGWKMIVVRDRKTREALARAAEPAAERSTAQAQGGETVEHHRAHPGGRCDYRAHRGPPLGYRARAQRIETIKASP